MSLVFKVVFIIRRIVETPKNRKEEKVRNVRDVELNYRKKIILKKK